MALFLSFIDLKSNRPIAKDFKSIRSSRVKCLKGTRSAIFPRMVQKPHPGEIKAASIEVWDPSGSTGPST
jgi:hypothetical protein